MLANFTSETCTGSGDILTLTGARSGYLPFSATFSNGDQVSYTLKDANGVTKIAGVGIYNNGTITRSDNWQWNGNQVITLPESNIALSAGVHVIQCSEHLNTVKSQVFSVTQKPGQPLSSRPSVDVVHWYSWDEPPFSEDHPYDQWFQIAEIAVPAEPAEPAAPTNLQGVPGDGFVDLTWNISSTTGTDAPTGQRLYINTVNDFATATLVVDDLGPSVDSYQDTGLTNEVPVFHWAVAFNDVGPSEPSNAASTTPVAEPVQQAPNAPTNVVATGGDGTVNVSWTVSNSTGLNAADGQRVFRNTVDNFGTATQLGADLDAVTSEINDSTAVNGTEYFYWPIAFNDAGPSVAPTSASATPTAAVEPPDGDYISIVLEDSPVMLLNGVEGGAWVDEIGTQNASLSGGYLPTTGVGGAAAVAFNGVTGFATLPDNTALRPTSAISHECWFKLDDEAEDLNSFLINCLTTGVSSAARPYAGMQYRVGGDIRWATGLGASTLVEPTADASLFNSNWHHVVATYNGAVLKIYADGSEILSESRSGGMLWASAPIYIGSKQHTSAERYFFGLISAPAIYNYALSAARVSAHYAAGAPE